MSPQFSKMSTPLSPESVNMLPYMAKGNFAGVIKFRIFRGGLSWTIWAGPR